MKIGEQIREYRKNAGLTQEQVANYLGVTAPAVNKWERGSTCPDISLLPALARLLKIDMNTLFSFQEDLTELEISMFINEITESAVTGNIISAFERTAEKIREYPHCDRLIYLAATVLNSSLALSAIDPEQKKEYKKMVNSWYEQVSGSQDEKIRYAALYALAMELINDSDYEKAAERMEQLPDAEFDKKLLQINLYMSEGENDAAALLVEGRIMELGSKIQSYLYQLIELEEKTGNHQMAERVAETADQMVSLFDLWNYGKKVPHFLVSLYRKEVDQSIEWIKEILDESQKPWNISESPLYYRLAESKSASGLSDGLGEVYLQAFIREAETQEEYHFLRGDERFRKILEEYGKKTDDSVNG